MNSREIHHCLNATPGFLGVFPADKIPKLHQYCSFVVNTDPSTEKGRHWVCFYVCGYNIYCYDPYGIDPIQHLHLVHFLKRRKYKYNTTQIQSFLSSVCGQHCIFFLANVNNGNTPEGIAGFFGENLVENDCFVTAWVNETFDFSLPILDFEFISQISLPQNGNE